MSTDGTRVELDFQSAVVTDGSHVEIYPNGLELEGVISKLYESNSVVAIHIIVEATGNTMTVCNFVDPAEDSKYKWPCKHFLIGGVCLREEDHEKKRQAALQPQLELTD